MLPIIALRPLSLARNNDCFKSGRQKIQRKEHVEASKVFPFIKLLEHQLLTYWCLTLECSPACNTKKWFFINLWRSTKCQNVLFYVASADWVFCESKKENSTCAPSVGSSYQMLVVHSSSLHTAWIIEVFSHSGMVFPWCGQRRFGHRCYRAPRPSKVDADEI